MNNFWKRSLALLCAFFIVLGAQPVARAADDYAIQLNEEAVTVKAGETVSLSATVTSNGQAVELGENVKLWWWSDSWNTHADGNDDAVLEGHDPNNGASDHVNVTVPSVGTYYIAAELQDAGNNQLAITYCTITVEEGEKEPAEPTELTLPNGDFEKGDASNWVLVGYSGEVADNEWDKNNPTNTLSLWLSNDEAKFGSASYTVELTAGTYYFTFDVALGSDNADEKDSGLSYKLTAGETELAVGDKTYENGAWDGWVTYTTKSVTIEENTEVTFTLGGTQPAQGYGHLDNLKLYGTGSIVSKAPDKVDADIYVPYVEGTEGDDFFRGTDVSSLLSILNSGATFKDWEGSSLGETVDEQGKGFMKLLADAGVNWIRLRVWNNPYDADHNGYGGGNCDVNAAVTMGKWATDAGVRVLIDFHYSDFWADPGKQKAPKAWAGMTADEKAAAISEFTTESLNTLLDAGVDVGMVQVGNETTNQICGEGDWANKAKLFDAGCDAVHAVAEAKNHPILAAIHFTNPERSGNYANFASNLSEYDVSYDVFASSYYPYWHGTLDNLTSVLNQVADTYDKKVIVAETSWAWTLEEGDGHDNTVRKGSNDNPTYPFSVQGQATEFASVAQAVKDVGENGIGIFYWENAWIPVVNVSTLEGDERAAQIEKNKELWEKHGSGWAASYAGEYDPNDAGKWYGGSAVDNQAMFDFDGKPLESLNVFKYMTTGTQGYENTITGAEDVTVEITAGSEFTAELMPKTVAVTYLDGTEAELEVTWNAEDLAAVNADKPGTYSVRGTVADENGHTLEFTAKVVVALALTGDNLLLNPGFEEEDMSMYTSSQAYAKRTTDDPHSGSYSLHFYNSSAVDFTTEQAVDLEPGHYAFTLFGQGGNVGDSPETYIYVVCGEDTYTADFALTSWNVWDSPIVEFTLTEAAAVKVGVNVTAAGGAWGTFDDWYLGAVEGGEPEPCTHPEASVEHIEAVKATMRTEGNIEYWHCKDCGKYFKDEALTEEITLAETVIPKLTADECWHPEDVVEHVEAKEATTESEGNIEYWHCKDCGKYFKDEALTEEITLAETVIPKLTTDPEPADPEPADPEPADPEPPQPTTPDEPALFPDVPKDAWYAKDVETAAKRGLILGDENGNFNPDMATTRGQLMTILARLGGVDTTGSVPWYKAGMDWAVEKGVSDGTSPEGKLTREQFVTMLYRYIGSPAVTGDLAAYPDAGKVSDWARNAMIWAVETGLINGTGDGTLDPSYVANRAVAATILSRFLDKFGL